MASERNASLSLNRRSLLKQLGLAPLLLRPSAFSSLALLPQPHQSSTAAQPPFTDVRYVPQYPIRSPLEDVLRLVRPGLDEFPTEALAAQIEATLARWAEHIQSGQLADLLPSISTTLQASSLVPAGETKLRARQGIESFTCSFNPPRPTDPRSFIDSLRHWIGPAAQVASLEFQITALESQDGPPHTVSTSVRYSLNTQDAGRRREQRVGTWRLQWRAASQPVNPDHDWTLTGLEAGV